MPEWGLTKAMRKTKPYGLDEWWLEPGKVITDPVHGDIFVTRLEKILLDTPPMQRLRRVRQLGTTHLVYPGGTHTRFSHSLGALRVVQTLLDVVIDQGERHHPVSDLFGEWSRERGDEASEHEEALSFATRSVQDGDEYQRRLAEATVLARLGALLHDLGHLPYGHAVEDDLRLLIPHDANESRFRRMWKQMISAAKERLKTTLTQSEMDPTAIKRRLDGLRPFSPGEPLHDDLRKLVLSNRKDPHGRRIDPARELQSYPFVADMVGNTICADLLDYLQRDHQFTGLPISLGQRYLYSFYITPREGADYQQGRMALRIHREGRLRHDVITEILKHLRYRYELQERVLVHHLKLTADAMVGKMIELWHTGLVLKMSSASESSHEEMLAEVPRDFVTPGLKPKQRNHLTSEERLRLIASWKLEKLFLSCGDDGMLEHLSEIEVPDNIEAQAPLAAARGMATDLLNRRLYRHAADAAHAYAAEDLYAEFGSAERRRELERTAAEHAGLAQPWQVIVWVPGPDMRLKLAELLVDHGQGIAKFKDYSPLGSDIYNAHRQLWKIGVFTHPDVNDKDVRAVLAKLAQKMGICWDGLEMQLGKDPDSWPFQLAAMEVFDTDHMDHQVQELVNLARDGEISSRQGENDDHKGLVRSLRRLAQAHDLL